MTENSSINDSGNNSSNTSTQATVSTQEPAPPPREFINVNTSENTLANKGLDSGPISKSDSKP